MSLYLEPYCLCVCSQREVTCYHAFIVSSWKNKMDLPCLYHLKLFKLKTFLFTVPNKKVDAFVTSTPTSETIIWGGFPNSTSKCMGKKTDVNGYKKKKREGEDTFSVNHGGNWRLYLIVFYSGLYFCIFHIL